MISPHFPPEFGWYGPGRDSMELALELSQRGHQVDVIACLDKLDEGETHQDGMRVVRVNWQNNMRKGESDSAFSSSITRSDEHAFSNLGCVLKHQSRQ